MKPDLQEKLRETAGEFIKVRGALQQANGLAVVNASPVTKARVALLNKRAGAIQSTVESVGKMVDGARRWFTDTFGTDVESEVPAANPTIAASIQTSIAAMNYFLRDARKELDAIVAKQQKYDALTDEQKTTALAELRGESAAVSSPLGSIPRKWLLYGALGIVAFVLLKGQREHE